MNARAFIPAPAYREARRDSFRAPTATVGTLVFAKLAKMHAGSAWHRGLFSLAAILAREVFGEVPPE